jgi:serine/threonine protein kinase
MKKFLQFKKGLKFDQYTLQRHIASGGNGEVWVAKDTTYNSYAIKLLTKIKNKNYNRFKNEVKIVHENFDIKGILPIIYHSLPQNPSTVTPYYLMPLAVTLFDALKTSTSLEIVKLMVEVADTLTELHNRDISHRDIKPANLLFYENRICLSDFGLVDFPEKKDLTSKREDVGPKWTMAPEMRRNAYSADGKKADPYSFIKSLWILLTKQPKGFDGQYFPDTILDLKEYVSLAYYQTLNDLLITCTDNDPNKRLSAEQISNRLKEWIKVEEDYDSRNPLQWKDAQKKLFPTGVPTRAIWEGLENIINVLNELSIIETLNHLFLPDGGGLNLIGVKKSHEDGCIEINVGFPIILKPKRLIFESFDYVEEWNYFRLESDVLNPSEYYPKVVDYEILTELEPLLYTDYKCSDYNDFNGKELPENARSIKRHLSEDSFVIFQNTSTYNKISSTYDGRHNKMTADQFREYIGRAVKEISQEKELQKNESTPTSKIRTIKPTSFRSKNRRLNISEIKLLKKIIALAKDKGSESDEIHKKFGLTDGFNFFDDNTTKSLYEPRPKSDLLKKFLENLSQKQLALVTAVMYGGRDGILPVWGTQLDIMINRFLNHYDLVYSICEKAPLAEYIKKGIRLYR